MFLTNSNKDTLNPFNLNGYNNRSNSEDEMKLMMKGLFTLKFREITEKHKEKIEAPYYSNCVRPDKTVEDDK